MLTMMLSPVLSSITLSNLDPMSVPAQPLMLRPGPGGEPRDRPLRLAKHQTGKNQLLDVNEVRVTYWYSIGVVNEPHTGAAEPMIGVTDFPRCHLELR